MQLPMLPVVQQQQLGVVEGLWQQAGRLWGVRRVTGAPVTVEVGREADPGVGGQQAGSLGSVLGLGLRRGTYRGRTIAAAAAVRWWEVVGPWGSW
jgi:hypothetical protein